MREGARVRMLMRLLLEVRGVVMLLGEVLLYCCGESVWVDVRALAMLVR